MFLRAIRLGNSNSGQQFNKECTGCSTVFEFRDGVAFKYLIIKRSVNLFISHFPLLVICETCIKSRSEKPLVTDLRTSSERRQNRIRDECLSILSAFTQTSRCYSLVP